MLPQAKCASQQYSSLLRPKTYSQVTTYVALKEKTP
jgi:hypothetical protein